MTESAANYWFWKNKGRCTNCHCRDALTVSGRALCKVCAEKKKIRALKYAQTHDVNAVKREWYRRKREAGLCVKCGKPAIPGKARCVECAVKQKKADNNETSDGKRRKP